MDPSSSSSEGHPFALFSMARIQWRREGGEVLVQDSVMVEKEAKSLFSFFGCTRQAHVAFLPEAGDSLLLREGSGASISSKFFYRSPRVTRSINSLTRLPVT